MSANDCCLFVQCHARERGYISIAAEAFRPSFDTVLPTLISVAEPMSRPALVHEYRLTPFSLGKAVSNGTTAEDVISFFERFAYNFRPENSSLYETVVDFIQSCMGRYNLVRTVIDGDRALVQCKTVEVAQFLLKNKPIRSMVVTPVEIREERSTWDDEEAVFPSFSLKSRAMAKAMSAQCVRLGLPIQQQYNYERDTSLRTVSATLKSQTKPRAYQIDALRSAATGGVLNSGCLLLPCGAGKTLLGIMLICEVKKPTLVVCAGAVSVEQWKNQILEYASLDAPMTSSGASKAPSKTGASRISCLTGRQKDEITEDTDVVLTTYSMLISAHRMHSRRLATKDDGRTEGETSGLSRKNRNIKEKLFSSFGLLILDEVHVIPADSFSESLSFIDAKGAVGLTATYVREDNRILNLFHLVGPKLFDISMETLTEQGYLARVHCVEVHVPMTKEFGLEYMDRCSKSGGSSSGRGNVPALILLAAANPNKMHCVCELVGRHLGMGSKILVFCDHILLLEEYGKILNAPVISGKTQHKDRLMYFSDFQSTNNLNVICISRVGDVSVNLPNANVVIQVSSHGGSRRQEAQRLGRILRPKERASDGHIVMAWFYSIISLDSIEMTYAAHRTSFLVDQGYSCRLMDFDPTTVKKMPEKEEREVKVAVGDAVSVKHEQLHGALHEPVLRTSASAQSIGSLPYQLSLLSRVVSSWELDYQRAQRETAPVDGFGESSSDGDGGEGDDVEVYRPYKAIKRENATRTGNNPTSYTRSIGDLLQANNDFVYHEM
ncbi:Helicase conserved C-terminal domain/Type III restriction enzyme, res subunit/SNF2 family N-terminal domain/ERCC3/RAD25/XPB C-terminal helicase, putative [Angomonas deanei]|uniref:DNA 3'-5' helicase n=1 Tax=Angomonas deanei TaxID=59799 RepID=A0A7G2C814_9TRYP|nr:Helicase conserved C-terminal domain/Type III restriction enzyme, res subunit/SNF2 family N-terminal domain/ERCC3/RAD25/XPB C-terminal helicase, putative [Angomonas deanei]